MSRANEYGCLSVGADSPGMRPVSPPGRNASEGISGYAPVCSDYARFEFASLFSRPFSTAPIFFRRSAICPAPAGRFQNRLGVALVQAFGGKALPCETSTTIWKTRVIDSTVLISNSRANGLTLAKRGQNAVVRGEPGKSSHRALVPGGELGTASCSWRGAPISCASLTRCWSTVS